MDTSLFSTPLGPLTVGLLYLNGPHSIHTSFPKLFHYIISISKGALPIPITRIKNTSVYIYIYTLSPVTELMWDKQAGTVYALWISFGIN